jgi:hypothetical protein
MVSAGRVAPPIRSLDTESSTKPVTTPDFTLPPGPPFAKEEHRQEPVPGGPVTRLRAGTAPQATAAAPGLAAPTVQDDESPPVLTAELAALSRARLSQSAREPARALAELDAYERLPRPHVLEAEATLLRMEALIQVGQATAASNLAREYLRVHPSSPHRSRLQRIADGE